MVSNESKWSCETQFCEIQPPGNGHKINLQSEIQEKPSSYKRMPYHSISPLIIFCHFLINSVTKPFSTKMTENNQSFFSIFPKYSNSKKIQKSD